MVVRQHKTVMSCCGEIWQSSVAVIILTKMITMMVIITIIIGIIICLHVEDYPNVSIMSSAEGSLSPLIQSLYFRVAVSGSSGITAP